MSGVMALSSITTAHDMLNFDKLVLKLINPSTYVLEDVTNYFTINIRIPCVKLQNLKRMAARRCIHIHDAIMYVQKVHIDKKLWDLPHEQQCTVICSRVEGLMNLNLNPNKIMDVVALVAAYCDGGQRLNKYCNTRPSKIG